ncbi:alkaline phosphatase family protein [Dictyobacter aurantiacus]|uniref:Alkaline phosphatase family protein n=1 Tax=Dictyobacter aurantiacus TaxID=1936993 RepID=A0A401ZIU2_9CHLR|nr:alkaline phosphatase family protein [Dictyobacter aurantiacus]GCE06767.1 hypothetical protein KDAU_40960 [Dictyobacter aurantiacus]
MKKYRGIVLVAAVILAIGLTSIPFIQNVQASSEDVHNSRHHVLLLSIDGFHAQDLARYVRLNPNSTLAKLSQNGVTYTNASTSKPSDSFPGILSMTTRPGPRSYTMGMEKIRFISWHPVDDDWRIAPYNGCVL